MTTLTQIAAQRILSRLDIIKAAAEGEIIQLRSWSDDGVTEWFESDNILFMDIGFEDEHYRIKP